jgi:hypothetical protein
MATYTPNKNIEQPAYNDPNWDVPLNDNFDIIDACFGGNVSLTSTSGTVNLVDTGAGDPNTFQCLSFTVSGVLVGNVTYNIPAGVGGQWIVYNTTTGSFSVTFTCGGVGGLVIPRGAIWTIWSNGSGFVRVTSEFPPGTVIPFYNTSVPTGWTLVTGVDNKALRVSESNGGSASGGGQTFDAAFVNNRSTNGYTLTNADLPIAGAGNFVIIDGTGTSYATGAGTVFNTSGTLRGGGQAHAHTYTLAVNYVRLLLGSKS